MTDVVVSEGQPGLPVMRASTVVETRITPGRPYSAEATTEFTQVLGDGNRIARKATIGPTGPLIRIEAASAPQKIHTVARGAAGPPRRAT